MPVRADHRSTPSFHTLAESIATCLALLTGTIALLRYYTRKNHAYLYLGTGFIGAGLLGIYHTVATSALVGPLMILPSPARHAASWLVMRTYLAVMLLLGCLLSGDEEESVSKGEIREWPVYLAGLFLFLISGIALLLMPTPSFTTQIPWYSKPLDLLIGIVFLATLSIYLYKRKWRVSTFEHWLVLSLLIGVGAQVLIARSMRLYDWQFDTAHILLSLSYGCALIGLLANMYRLFQFAEKSRQELLKSATSLRQAHEEAQHAQMMQAREEQRFKLAVEGTGDGIWEWDLQTNQIWCSERFAHLLGYSSANALRRLTDFTRLIHPEDLHQWEQIRADVENAQRHDLEVRLRHRSQKYRWFQARAIVEIQDGEPVRMVGSIQDITELKRAMSFAALHGAVGVALAVTYPTRPMLQRCVEAMGQHLPIAQVAIWTLQEDEMLEMQARIGLVEQPETSLPRASWYDSDLGMIGQSAQPFHTNNIRESNMVPDRLTMLEEDIVEFAGFRLLIGDK